MTFGCRNKCTGESRGLRGCERKAAAVACVQFQELKSCGQCRGYCGRASSISGLHF